MIQYTINKIKEIKELPIIGNEQSFRKKLFDGLIMEILSNEDTWVSKKKCINLIKLEEIV